jgi:hypothetical protein
VETMSESNDLKPTGIPGTPVPDLIEQYRMRRDAWIAQADELARLRDEVRGSAEREAMEIVTAARRDVRQIVMEARRELLVLSAQVQAALGEAGARPDPTALLNRARDDDGGLPDDGSEFSDAVFAPEEAVKGMLEEARADMDALAEDARTVPFQALAQAPVPFLAPPPEPPSFLIAEEPPEEMSAEMPDSPAMSATPGSLGLLSSPFPTESVPVPSGRRLRTFVTLFGAAGVAVFVGTFWWLTSGDDTPAPETTARTETAAPATAPAPTPAEAPSSAAVPAAPAPTRASASELSLVVEARRASWMRTTVDGQQDAGRMVADGEKITINARRSVSLRVGDAGAVYVSLNKGQAMPLGRDGQVVTRQFVVENGERGERAAPPPPTAPADQPQVPALSAPVASAPPAPAPVPVNRPTPLPLVQPVAAASPPAAPALEPVPTPPARAERAETTPPPVAPRAELPNPPRAELPNPGPSTPASAVIAASRQWLDAYHRQDRAAMATLSTDGLQLADERRNEERFPANADVNRSLDRVSVQIAADTAVLTAVMTERTADGAPPRVSPISQVWVLSGNQWRVRQVRLVSEARLNQIFR